MYQFVVLACMQHGYLQPYFCTTEWQLTSISFIFVVSEGANSILLNEIVKVTDHSNTVGSLISPYLQKLGKPNSAIEAITVWPSATNLSDVCDEICILDLFFWNKGFPNLTV